MVFTCCVPKCKYKNTEMRMHSFPKDPQRFQIWAQSIGRRDLSMEKIKSYRICDIHFSHNQTFVAVRNRSNLKAEAVPDMHLPQSESNGNISESTLVNPKLGPSAEGIPLGEEKDHHCGEKGIESGIFAMDESNIQKFYKSCNVFITGGTGFMGKLLIEKLLRSTDASTIYVLIREKKGKNAHSRIDELFDDVIFDRLKRECPKYKNRIEAISGDCSVSGLGLNITDRQKLMSDIHVIFHVAATVKFDENLKLAYSINVKGTKDVLDLARQMKNLKSVIHVSTAFSNCHLQEIEEKFYNCPYTYEDIDKILEKMNKNEVEQLTPRIIKPWPNTYTFTKALAESMIKETGSGLPLGIFRPAIVISTYREPVEGWIDNLYGPTGVVTGAITGVLRVIQAEVDNIADTVPADTCVAGLIASAYDVANKKCQRTIENIPIYNYVSSPENPITWNEFIQLNLIHGSKYPVISSIWAISLMATPNLATYTILRLLCHTFPALLFDVGAVISGNKPRMLELYKKIHKFTDILVYFCLRRWKFSNKNTVNMWSEMNKADRELFPFSMTTVHWLIYFRNYIRGIRQYLLKESESTLDVAKKRDNRFSILHKTMKVILAFVACNAVSLLVSRMYSLFF